MNCAQTMNRDRWEGRRVAVPEYLGQQHADPPEWTGSWRARGGLLAILLGFLWVPLSPRAQLPVARLAAIFPPGGKSGATFEVSVSGVDLDDASRIFFSRDGINAKPKISDEGGLPEPNKFVITVASNAPPGIYEARIVCRFGITNPRAFAVSDRTEISEPSNNQSLESAAEVPLETIVNGHADANAADYFKFQGKKNQRVLIECLTRTIDSRMDPVLVLYDENGLELDRNRRGGLLDFTPEADGRYVLKIHDFLFRGGDDYFYRLSVGTGPHIDFIFPPAGLAGTKSKYTLYGRNLPEGTPSDFKVHGKTLDRLVTEIELPANSRTNLTDSPDLLLNPADAAVEGIEYRLRTPRGVSNPVLISYATAPVIAEEGPNEKPESAQKVTVPCEFVGQFYAKNDRDWIAFEAKKGEIYWVEVFSQRLGWPTDPFVLIQRVTKNAKGEEQTSDVQEMYDLDTNIGGPEFNTASRDVAGRLEIKESGTYRIEVRDLFNYSESDPRLTYRLSIRQETPDFRLVALPQPPPPATREKREATPWTPFLRKGETIAIKVLAFRRDNFNGEIRLAIEGLPAGVHCSEGKIEPNKTSSLIFLTADENAAGWIGTIKIWGNARIGESDIVREAREGDITWLIADYTNEPVQSRIRHGLMLAVSEKETAPFAISPAQNTAWETCVAGKLQIPIKVQRGSEFSDTIKLKASGLAPLDPMKEIDVSNKTNETMLTLDLTQFKIPVGTHRFYLQAQTKGKYRRLTPDEVKTAEAAAKTAEEVSNKAEKEAADLAAAAKKASEDLAAATKSAQEAEAQSKAAAEKLVTAKTAAEKTTGNEDLIAARNSAEKEASEAAVRGKAAAEAKTAAEKNAHEASAKSKEAEKRKETAAKHAKGAKQLMERTQLKDLAITAYSAPINLTVTPAPIKLMAEMSTSQVKQGAKIEIPVKINRLYGFADPVEIKLVSPQSAKGLSAPTLTIPKDETQTKLVIEAGPDSSPGEHKLTLQASLKLNNQDLKVEQSITLKVETTEKTKS